MKSPALAIAFAIWSRHRWGFLGLAGILVVCTALAWGLPRLGIDVEFLRDLMFVPLCLSELLVFVLFSYTEPGGSGSLAGFPSRLFTLPVRTRWLVSLPMLYGAAILLATYAWWAKVIFYPFGPLDYLWPVTVIVTGLMVCQCLVWCLAGFRLLRLVVLGLAGSLLFTIGLVPYLLQDLVPFPARPVLTVLLALLGVGAYVGALAGLESQRRGGGRGAGWLRALVQQLDRLRSHQETPFGSVNAAMFWFEWQRSGRILPMVVAAIQVGVLAPIAYFTGTSAGVTGLIVLWAILLPLILASLVGKGFAKADFWSAELAVPTFMAVRPVDSGQIVFTKLKVAAASAGLSWLVVLFCTSISIALWCDVEPLIQLADHLGRIYSGPVLTALLAPSLAAAVVLTWRLLVTGLPIGLAGRLWPFFFSCCSGFLGIATSLAILIWYTSTATPSASLVDRLPWLKHVFEHFPEIAWGLAIVLGLKMLMAAILWPRASERGHIDVVSARRFWSLALATAVLTMAGAFLLGAITEGVRLEGIVDLFLVVPWARYFAALAGLLLYPIARLGLAPISLAWNRHR